MQQRAGELRVLFVVLVQTENGGLDHEMSEAVGGGGKHVGDAGVQLVIVTGICGQPLSNHVWAQDVEQVVSESNDLR